ncbi:MAG: FadR family transcriptional regulator [Burkholderiales bacterium]|nr:FadR family transcriptional regulator [Burkholderiales bacterium]
MTAPRKRRTPRNDTVAEPQAKSETPEFKAIHSTRAFEEIAAQIRANLAEGRLQVGDRLPSERALAEQFGVSRNTLREALRLLEHAGLLRLHKGAHGGAFISERSGDAVIAGLKDLYHLGAITPAQLTQARIWLEEIVVREACRLASAEELDALEANVHEAQEAERAGDFERRSAVHLEFHRMLARMTGNPIIVVMMSAVIELLAHFIRQIGARENPYVVPSRKRLLKHLRARDADAAVLEMTALLKRLQRGYLSRVDSIKP